MVRPSAPSGGSDAARTGTTSGRFCEVALLQYVAGLHWSEIGRRVSAGESSAKRRYQIHGTRMETMGEFGEVVSAVATECLRG